MGARGPADGGGKGTEFTGKPLILIRRPWCDGVGRCFQIEESCFYQRSVLFFLPVLQERTPSITGVGMDSVALNPNIYIPGELVLLSCLQGQLRCQHVRRERMPATEKAGLPQGSHRKPLTPQAPRASRETTATVPGPALQTLSLRPDPLGCIPGAPGPAGHGSQVTG